MKLIEIRPLAIPDVKVLRFGRFRDERGYFTEHFRRSDLAALDGGVILDGGAILQANESRSRAGVVRGLHIQWEPVMGKLVRTVDGRMVDLVLDLRKGSPSLGRVIAYDMPADPDRDWDEWIWVPVGFAHGNYFTEPSAIEYFCTSAYGPGCEAGISPLAPDLDWSLCDPALREEFQGLPDRFGGVLLSEKDRAGLTLAAWLADPLSDRFRY
ncbi:MAG: dTDP-4-dehydrorhamnose 3,5-epimerase family protein [Acidobacteria bacterium]|nr:dTDP-4-dehydrorhamnose 3,5-epimerase family protein [Acidobacteriota bacterium]